MKSKETISTILLTLREFCEKSGLKFQMVDRYSNNLVEISNGKKSFFANRGKIGFYPLNSKFSVNLVADKAWTYEILKKNGFIIPHGEYFFIEEGYLEFEKGKYMKDAINFAKNKYPVFVKPNSGSSGYLSEIINNETELIDHLKKISEEYHIGIIQEVIKLPEYRIFAIDGEVEFVYQRNTAMIKGNGQNTIEELIKQKNIQSKFNIENSIFLKKKLKKLNLKLNSVLKKDFNLEISSTKNISAGGSISNYSEKVSKETQKWVKKVTDIFSIRVCGIDIFTKSDINNPEDFIVIEINSNPFLSGIKKIGKNEKVFQIWKKITDKFFNE